MNSFRRHTDNSPKKATFWLFGFQGSGQRLGHQMLVSPSSLVDSTTCMEHMGQCRQSSKCPSFMSLDWAWACSSFSFNVTPPLLLDLFWDVSEAISVLGHSASNSASVLWCSSSGLSLMKASSSAVFFSSTISSPLWSLSLLASSTIKAHFHVLL